jgi:hypothetical protein
VELESVACVEQLNLLCTLHSWWSMNEVIEASEWCPFEKYITENSGTYSKSSIPERPSSCLEYMWAIRLPK